MKHLSEQELLEAYYGDDVSELRRHLDECLECRSNFDRVREMLDSMRGYPVPARSASYGSEVWARLLPQLPTPKSHRRWFQWWTLAPVLAALLIIAFVGGMLTQQRRGLNGISEKARQRVLLMAMSDHLERSQIVLAELVNATPGTLDVAGQRERARDLLDENRLLRQSAVHLGDTAEAGLLDELERVLLDVANSPSSIPPADLEALQSRVESEGLLFKVRITSTDARERGQKL
ncbi:MAG: hypothetical protein WB992_24065 [Bryobacteraceae bacterium]